MAKKEQKPQPQEQAREARSPANVQNSMPQVWNSFEACWNSCVKNGTKFQMEACKEHLKSLGWLKDQSRWIEGIKHFGVKVER